jgi:hypothetical protein
LQNALQYLRQENSRIQFRNTAASDAWLSERLLPQSKADTPEGVMETKRMGLVSDLRNFMSSCQIIDVKSIEIGGKGWKPRKTTAAFIVLKQQEKYHRLCARKDNLYI